jgi:hypothetical protein
MLTVQLYWRYNNEAYTYYAFETGSEARAGIARWIDFYNHQRPHSSLGGITPTMHYEQGSLKAA